MGGAKCHQTEKDNDEDADEDKGSTSFARATQLPGFERSTVFQVRFQCKPRVKLFCINIPISPALQKCKGLTFWRPP